MRMELPRTARQILPPGESLVTGRQNCRRRTSALRPQGTRDWLLIFTRAGRAYFRSSKEEWIAQPNELVLFRPGTPQDYGLWESHGHWKNIWVHFLPRHEWTEWLKWPEIFPGVMHLRPDDTLAREVGKEMARLDLVLHGPAPLRRELGINALERVFLLADSINPLHRARKDSRVVRAMDILCGQSEEPFHLETLARRCGLSRSRLAELFQKQVGTTPLAFLEEQRLRRVREFLQLTDLGLAAIAEQTGFASPYYLSLRFKKAFGCNPREFRRTHHQR